MKKPGKPAGGRPGGGKSGPGMTRVLKQRVTGLRDVIEVAPEPSTAFVSVDTLRVGPP